METRGEVGGEERPDREGAEEVGAVGEGTGGVGLGEEDVDEVGEEEGPSDRDGAEEKEGGEEEGYAEGVCEDDEGLEAPLEWDGEGGEVDAWGGED